MRHKVIDSKTKQLLQHRAQLMRAYPSWPEQVLWRAIHSGQARGDRALGRLGYRVLRLGAELVVKRLPLILAFEFAKRECWSSMVPGASARKSW